MALFGLTKKQAPQAPSPAAPEPIASANARISLAKPDAGDSSTITVSNGWAARGKDYDLKARVLYKDGRKVYIGAANGDEHIATNEGAVRHSGDSRAPGVDENLSVR